MDGLLVTSITSLRRIASNLRPRALDEGGLYFALQKLRHDFLQRRAIHFDLLADEADLVLIKGKPDKLEVSRSFLHLFKQM